MTVIVQALFSTVSAFFFALSAIAVRFGTLYSPIETGILVAVTVTSAVFLTLTIISVPLVGAGLLAVILFGAAGILSNGLGRPLRYFSIQKIGVPITYTMSGSTPLFVALGAVSLLNEQLTLQLGVGTGVIVAGVMMLHLGYGNATKASTKYLLIALIPAIMYGFASTPRKAGLLIFDSPLLGTAVSFTAALLVLAPFFVASRHKIRFNRRGTIFYALSGILEGFAVLTLLYSYSFGSVIVAENLNNTAPLFALVLSSILLRRTDPFTNRTIIASLIILAGAFIVINQ